MPKTTTIKHRLSILLVTLLSLSTTNAWAGLVIDITEGAGGSTVFELTGSGTVLGAGAGARVINIGTVNDSFLMPGTFLQVDQVLSSTINLGSASTNRAFLIDSNGAGGLNSRLGFGGFSNIISVGDSLADMSGSYLADTILYSAFVAGSYNATLGFPTDPGSVTNLGDIIINVGMTSVPEPGVLALLAIGLALVGLRHRATR